MPHLTCLHPLQPVAISYIFSRALSEIQSCGNPRWGFWLYFIECQHKPLREKPHPVHYGSSVNWGWLKGSLIWPAQLQKWVMAPEDEKPRGINLDLVQLSTVLVFLSSWGQEMTSLNLPAWQRAEFGEDDADGSTEPCCSASTCLKDLSRPTLCGKCFWKSCQDPRGSELREHRKHPPELLPWGYVNEKW